MENFTIKTPNASFTTNLLINLVSKIKTKKSPTKSFVGLFMLLLTFFLGGNVSAQSSYTWTGGGSDSNWSTGNNWGGAAPATPQAYLNFAGTTGLSPFNNLTAGGAGFQIYFKSAAGAFTLSGNSINFFDYSSVAPNIQNEGTNLQTITLNILHSNTGESGYMNINGNAAPAGPLTFGGTIGTPNDATARVLQINNGNGTGTVTFNGIISEGGTGKLSLLKQGANGNAVLSANNTYSGGTTVNAGTLQIGSGSTTGTAGTGAISIANGATMLSNRSDTPTLSNALTLTGTSGAHPIFSVASGMTATFTGAITSSGGEFWVNDASNTGTLIVNRSANAHNVSNVIQNGVLQVADLSNAASASSLGKGLIYFKTAGTTATLNYTGGTATTDRIGALSLQSANSGSVISVSTAATILTLSAAISESGSGSGYTKSGSGTLLPSGVNTYAGPTVINAGTLKLGSTTALGTSSATSVVSGAVLDLNGFTLSTARPLTINGTGLTATPAGALTNTGGNASYSGALILGSSSGATITTTASGTLTCSGGVTGATFPLTLDGAGTGTLSTGAIATTTGTVTKNGTGTWTLSASNSYTGATTINAGTLKAGIVTSAFGSGSAVTLGNISGAIIDITGFNNTIGSLAGGGATGGNVTLGAATLTAGSNNTSTSYGGIISGTGGALVKSGTGTLTLNGSNTYTGTTTISAGTLQISAAERISNSSNMVLSGGTFSTGASAGFSETVGTLQLTSSSTIALGSGSHTLTFGASNGTTWNAGQTLTITGWSGSAGTTGLAGRIFMSSATGLTATQLAQISFSGFTPSTAMILSTGEIVPKATQFYVSTTGNDTTGTGVSSGSPMATIAKVLSSYTLMSGDVINVAAGTYSETAIVVGSDDAGFTIQGAALSGGVPTTIYSSTNISRWLYIGNGNNGTTVLNNTNITINNITVQNYKATGSGLGGGAIYIEKGATGTAISNCVFNNCTNSLSTTEYGGAIMSNDYFTVTNSVFKNCTSDQGGGAVALWTGPTGGTYTSTLPSLISKCTFFSNTCTNYDGSAVFNGKGLTTGGAAVQLNVFNSLFYSNSAGSNNGCIVSNNGSVINMMNCTVTKNSSTGGTGGLYSASSKVLATNCIIYGNTGGITQKDFNCASSTDMYINTCLYQFGGSASITGTNVTNLAPGFTNASTNDYTIVSGSAGINKGTFSSTLNSITTNSPGDDILSATRTGYPDMGCYESQDCSVVPATSFTATSITSSSMTVGWTRGAGAGVLVLARLTSDAITEPTNGTAYSANAAYATGAAIGSGYVVYNGTGTSVAVTGLAANSSYTFDIYEYNNTSSPLSCLLNYGSGLTTELTGAATTLCVAPSTPSSAITFANVNANSMKISWTIGNGTNHVVRIKAVSAPTALVNGTAPATASPIYASDGILYNSTGNSVTVTGLSASTVYYVSVTESNCSGTGIIYSAAVTSNTTTPSGNTFYSTTATANTDATVPGNWNTATDGTSGVFAVASNFSSANNTFIIQTGHQYKAGTGSSTWTGGTTNSVVQINSGGALDISACNITGFSGFTIAGTGVSSTGALYNSGNVSSFAIPITLGGAATVSNSGAALTVSSTIANSGNTLTLDSGNGTILTLSGLISGGGGLTKTGTGTAVLSNASSSYTGTTSIDNGTIRVTAGSVTPSAIGPLGLNASLNLNGGALETSTVTFSRPIVVTNNGSRIDAFGASASYTISGGITATGAYTLSLGGTTVASNAGQPLILSGIIGNGTGTLSLTKVLTSSVTLSGANTYSGTTTLGASAGTLNINNATALGTGTFAITGNGSTINNSTAGSITLSNNNPITVGGDFTFTGTGALNLGTGPFTLTANSSATVSASTLTIGSDPVGSFMLIKSPKSGGTLTVTPLKSALASWALTATSNAGTSSFGAATSLITNGTLMSPNGAPTASTSGSSATVSVATTISTASNYFEFAYTPNQNVSITQIQFDYFLGLAKNYTLALYYTNNGGTLTQINANVTSINNTGSNVMLADFAGTPITVSSGTIIRFRIFAAYGTSATTVNLANFNILGTAQPAFTTSVASLTGFSSCAGTASTFQSFSVSGTNMNNNVVVTAPTGYEVSLSSGGTYTSNVSIIPSSGSITSIPVYVRLSNTASGTPSGTITCTSIGASSQNVSVSGTVTALPTTATNGSTQTICVSGGTATLSGNTALSGTGAWSVSGPSTSLLQFSSTSSPTATFTPAGGAGSYVVTWTISNSPCTASAANATITVSSLNAVPNYVVHTAGTGSTSNACSSSTYWDATPTAGVALNLKWNIELNGQYTNTGIYYTTDGSTPSGSRGVGSGTTTFVAGSYFCTSGSSKDVAQGTIPAIANVAGKTINYIIGAWNGCGTEGFAAVAFTSGNTTPTVYTYSLGDPSTADYRSRASSSWNTVATWEYNYTTTGGIQYWANATQVPAATNNVLVQAAHTVTLDVSPTVNSSKTITLSGTLVAGTNTISGAGSFVTSSGATLKTGNANGITSSGTSGTIQVSGTRTFNAGSNYEYNGAVNQATGNGLPTTLSGTLTINNSGSTGNNTVSLTTTGTTAPTLNLTSGLFAVGSSNTLNITSGGTVTATSGNFASGTSGGTVNFNGSGTISGTVGFNNASLSGGVDFGSASTINGNLTINLGGYVATNAPTYATNSTLIYNSGTTYGRNLEWSTTTGKGYPYNVQISGNTTLDVGANSGNATARQIAGNLTTDSGSTFTMNSAGSQMSAAVTVYGNVLNNGTITLSSVYGGDINVKGNWTDNSTFNANTRAVFFTGSGTQTIDGTASAPFNIDYVVVTKSAGAGPVVLNKDLLVGAPSTGTAITLSSANDILDLNGHTITIGTTGVACGISGTGTFKGSSSSNISILGTGAFGTVYFDQTTPGTTNVLNGLTLNRTSTLGGMVLGNDVNVSGTLTLTSGTFDLSSNNLTIGGSGSISVPSPSATTMVIASSTGQLRKTFTANGSFTFPVGDNTGTAEYSPVTIAATGSAYSSAYIGVSLADATHTNNYSTTNYLTRYWNVIQSGITGCTATVTGTYINTASDVAGTLGSIKAAQLNGIFNQSTNPWIKTGGSVLSGTTLTYTAATLTSGQTSAFTGITAADPSVSITGGNVTVCKDAVTSLTANPTGGDGTLTYSWSGLITGSTTSSTATATTSSAGGPNSYTVTVKDANGISAASSAATVTVTAPTAISSQSTATQTQCINGTFSAISVTATGTSPITYQWYSNTTASTSGGSTLSTSNGAQTSSYTPQASSSGTLYYYCIVHSGCGTDVTSAISGAFIVTPANTAGTASSTPTVCISTAITSITHSTTGATGISNSGVSGANGLPTGVSASWSSNTITISGTPTAAGTFSYSIPLTGGCGSINATGTITVTPASVGGTASATAATLCTGGSTTIALTGNTGTIQWQQSADGSTGWATVSGGSGGTTATYTTPTLSATTYYRAVVTNGVCSSATSSTASVTINAASVGGTASATAATLCTGTSTTIALTGNTGTIQWQQSADGSTGWATVSGGSGGTTSTYTTPTLSATTYYRAVVTNGVCSSATSSTASVTVTSNNTAGTASSTPTVCISTAITSITHSTTGATGISNSGVSGANGLPTGVSASWSSNTVTISGTPTASGVFNYSIPLTGGCGSINATGTITVNAASVGGTATATALIRCSGTSTTLVLSGNTGSTIQWQQSSSADGSTGWSNVTGGSGATSSTYSTPNLTATTYYKAVVTSGSCTSSDSSTASVTMEVVAANTSSQTICSGVANLSASVPSSNTTGAWTIVSGPNTSTTQFSNTALPSASFTPTTAGSYVIRWTISGGFCSTSYADATIVVGSGSATTWNGTAWSNGAPTSTSTAYITGNYSSTTNGGSIIACTLTVSNNAVVNIASANDIILNGILTVGTGSSVTIENNASLVQSANVTNVGKIIFKHNSSALFRLDYTLWSSPVASQNLVLFSPLTSVSPSRFYTYNTSTDLYDPITPPSASTFNIAQGYLIRMPNTWIAVGAGSAAAWTGTFTGVPNNGNISITMSNAGQGYNAVGNPYPSAINFANFVYANSANIEGTVYFWRKTNNSANPVSYSTCTTVGCTVNNGHTYTHPELISAGQGFIVQAKAGRTTLNFTNGMRTSDNVNQFFRTSVVNRFWLELSNTANASFGKKLIAYIPDATLGYDSGLDGLFLNDTKTALLSVADNHDLVIQARPAFTADDVVPLVLKADVADTYTITLQEVEGVFNGSQTIFLKDKLTNTSHDFSTGAYTFTTDAGRFDNRFEIVYQNPLAVQQPTFNDTSVVVYKQNNELIINSGNTSMSNVKVFDIRGRLLMEKNNINATQTKFYTGTTNEVLLVQITSDAMGTVTKKVIN